MGYTVSVNHPHFPIGTEFNVGNLGRVPNGGSMEVDEESERLFVMSNGRTLDDAFINDHAITVSGSSALSEAEIDSVLAFFNPVEVEPTMETKPAWLAPQEKNEGGDE